MASLKNSTKQKIEHLLEMNTGYVLDFSNASFRDFIKTSVGVDMDEKYPDGSKATRLREFWHNESDTTVVVLMSEMLDRWLTSQLMNGGPSTADKTLHDQALAELTILSEVELKPTFDELQFLDKDLGNVDLSAVPVSVTFQDVVKQRRDEIDQCLKAGVPLATIFLCGSTLEGLLFAIAEKNPRNFNQAKAAPTKDGQVKPFGDWTLQNLVDVSRELGLIGEDVSKYSHAVRDFRNYIHPRQQIRENFTPRMVTAEIAHKVLEAAIADLAALQQAAQDT